MSEDFVQARVAKVNLRLPVYRDRQTTLAIAEEVSARVAAMEEQAGRIDSQAFALQAAFAYAVELHAEKAERDGDTRDLVKALDRIASQLKRLLEQSEK
jgi:cell division protein ZapA (FtsZ GTPase activity inhibitor)